MSKAILTILNLLKLVKTHFPKSYNLDYNLTDTIIKLQKLNKLKRIKSFLHLLNWCNTLAPLHSQYRLINKVLIIIKISINKIVISIKKIFN